MCSIAESLCCCYYISNLIQGNEEEAMRCWKSAVQQIQNQQFDDKIPEYAALTETEKALSDSLRELEYQARERIDLLEALKESRQEDPFQDQPSSSLNSSHSYSSDYNGHNGYSGYGTINGGPSQSPSPPSSGYIGGGTIPAITYGELSRPELCRAPPPVPPRTSASISRTASNEQTSRPSHSAQPSSVESNGWNGIQPPVDLLTGTDTDLDTDISQSPHNSAKRTSRSPNKDKQYTLRPTLRSGPNETAPKSSRSSRSSRSSASKTSAERQGASKAATLAWTALGLSSYGKSNSSRKAAVSSAEASTSKSQPKPSASLQMPQVVSRRPLRDTSPILQPALQWDSNSRRLVPQQVNTSPSHSNADLISLAGDDRYSGEYSKSQSLSLNAAASALGRSIQTPTVGNHSGRLNRSVSNQRPLGSNVAGTGEPPRPQSTGNARFSGSGGTSALGNRIEIRRNVHSSYAANVAASNFSPSLERGSGASSSPPSVARKSAARKSKPVAKPAHEVSHLLADVHLEQPSSEDSDKVDDNDKSGKDSEEDLFKMPWKKRKQKILKSLPAGVDDEAAKQILNEIVVQGDIVHWSDIAGLEPAKKALREVVVYPFLRPDLFMGLREPATGMLLFGPPGTGKTMLARAVATESRSTFFSISASSLTSKYLGESEKLVRALFSLAKMLAPSIIFVDEIDSILSQRSGSGEHEATRRIKTEFLIQWSDLQRAAAGREEHDEENGRRGDASRVLVLAATNLPWAIDEAARRRFVRRQYIPLPERETRAVQLHTLLGQQKHSLTEADIQRLVELTDGKFCNAFLTYPVLLDC